MSELWIDSLALSRIALPRLASHKLSFIAETFGCASVSHRACDDVDALAGVWRILLTALSDLPAGLLQHLADMHPRYRMAVPGPYSRTSRNRSGDTVLAGVRTRSCSTCAANGQR